MIEGLKLDVRAEELKARIGARIAEHQAKVDAYPGNSSDLSTSDRTRRITT